MATKRKERPLGKPKKKATPSAFKPGPDERRHKFKSGDEWDGNAGGRPKKFNTIVTDAVRELLGEIDEDSGKTNAQIVAEGIVGFLVAQGKTKLLDVNYKHILADTLDRCQGKAIQKVEVDDKRTDASPRELIARLLARGIERSASEFDSK